MQQPRREPPPRDEPLTDSQQRNAAPRDRSPLFVLNENVSGMNRFFFRELEKEYALAVKDVARPEPYRYLHAAIAFHPNIALWRRRFDRLRVQYFLSPQCFKERSRLARALWTSAEGADAVLQIGAMFNGVSHIKDRPKLGFASWNLHLSRSEWPEWAPQDDRAFLERYRMECDYYSQLDLLLCTNEYVMRSFVRDYGLPHEKLRYIGYGAKFETLPDVEKRYGSNLALFVGYDFERKGGPTVVEAFRRVRDKLPQVRLRIIGPKHLDPRYCVPGVEHIVNITDRSVMNRHFQEADFFVMPSACEPFGLVFLEAMAFRNACIGSCNDAMPEFIEHGVNGYTIPAGDVERLAFHMQSLYQDDELKARLGSAAYDLVRKNFTWEACGARVRSALRGVFK